MFGPKKDKTILDVFEDELKRQHSLARGITTNAAAERCLAKMIDTLCELVKTSGDAKLNQRIKSMEDSIGDLYLTGRDKK